MISEIVILFLLAITVFLFFGRLAELLFRKHRNSLSLSIPETGKASDPEASPVKERSFKVSLSG